MTDEEMAEEYAISRTYPKFETSHIANFVLREVEGAFLTGLNTGRPQWHKVSDRLPEMGELVYFWNKTDDYPVVARRHIPYGREEWVWDCKWGSGFTVSQSEGKDCLWTEIVLPNGKEQNAGEDTIESGVSGSVSEYRPFNNCDELVECWEKKMLIPAVMFTKDERDKLYRPSIWVKSKVYGTDNLIVSFDSDNESIGGSCVFLQDMWVDMKELFDNFTFLDGSPCGKE